MGGDGTRSCLYGDLGWLKFITGGQGPCRAHKRQGCFPEQVQAEPWGQGLAELTLGRGCPLSHRKDEPSMLSMTESRAGNESDTDGEGLRGSGTPELSRSRTRQSMWEIWGCNRQLRCEKSWQRDQGQGRARVQPAIGLRRWLLPPIRRGGCLGNSSV